MNRKPWTFGACIIIPQTGSPRYFGCANFVPDSRCTQYQTVWWKVSFPDNTWVFCGTKLECKKAIGSRPYKNALAKQSLDISAGR